MIPTTEQIKNQLIPRLLNQTRANSTDTTTTSSGVQVAIGDSQPLDKSFWFDTSDYASIQGAIETFTLTAENFDSAVEVGNTQPTYKNIWFDTSNYE